MYHRVVTAHPLCATSSILTSSSRLITLTLLHAYLTLVTAEANCPPCTENHFNSVKQVCRTEGQTLSHVDHEQQTNATIVCIAFHELLKCVAQRVPECLATIGDEYQQYTMTPWDCHLDEHKVLVLQNFLQVACQQRLVGKDPNSPEENKDSPDVNFSNQDHVEKSQTKTYRINNTSSNNQSSNTANGLHHTGLLHNFSVQHIPFWCGLLFVTIVVCKVSLC